MKKGYLLLLLICTIAFHFNLIAQVKRTPEQDSLMAQTLRKTKSDYANMMSQLGITSIRQGVSGTPTAVNAANYDETKAVIFPNLPPVLTFQNGKTVKSLKAWEGQRVPEIFELFDREIYGRVPANIPKINWVLTSSQEEKLGEYSVIVEKLQGMVDNNSYPSIEVKIDLTLTIPKDARGKIPVITEFAFVFPPGMRPPSSANSVPEISWQQQVISRGWAAAVIIPTSFQADNGAGLTKGIIGLMNQGKFRKQEDWGTLRAWAWGASSVLDYFETRPNLDSKHVGIFGHSRFGKAASVTMAYDKRFATAFICSSGAGGLKIHRRNFGEAVENVASSNEYHWMAGNFIKYAGPLQWSDLPIDSHELIALMAPRPIFISAGSAGDLWADPKGMFDAGIGANPAYALYKKLGLSKTNFPDLGQGILDGQIGFRQHEKGHTPGPNWPYFLDFAAKQFK